MIHEKEVVRGRQPRIEILPLQNVAYVLREWARGRLVEPWNDLRSGRDAGIPLCGKRVRRTGDPQDGQSCQRRATFQDAAARNGLVSHGVPLLKWIGSGTRPFDRRVLFASSGQSPIARRSLP